MSFGLFGKLPQKRDFLSVNLPHAVLNPFETWLQSAVAASRNEIGRGWEDYYLVAPIWRFWLGRDIMGTACTGSLMPSVDQVGRYFPLAIIYWAEPGETLVPPLLNPIEDWYRRIEERLLGVLSEDNPIEVNMILSGLMPPDYSTPPSSRPNFAPPVEFAPSSFVPAPPPEIALAAPPSLPAAAPVESVTAPAEPQTAASEDSAEPAAPEEPAAAVEASVAEVALAEPEPVADAAPVKVPDGEALWAPEPMPADKLADLQRISAASFAPQPVIPMGPGSPWDPRPEAAATPPIEHKPESKLTAMLWDDAPAPEPKAMEQAVATASPAAATAPIAVLSGNAPLSFAPGPPAAAAPPATAVPAAVAAPIAPFAVVSAPAVPQPVEVPITTTDFKGGLVAVIEGGAGFAEARLQLMALDFGHAAQSRGYWWCGPSSGGGPRMFSKAGLPDPYFFTRMLMWPGK